MRLVICQALHYRDFTRLRHWLYHLTCKFSITASCLIKHKGRGDKLRHCLRETCQGDPFLDSRRLVLRTFTFSARTSVRFTMSGKSTSNVAKLPCLWRTQGKSSVNIQPLSVSQIASLPHGGGDECGIRTRAARGVTVNV